MVFRLGVVAGETSGDALGARVVASLRAKVEGELGQELVVEGVGGPQLEAAGCRSLYSIQALSVMGVTEPLMRLPQLLAMRRGLAQHFIANPPDVFLGVDSPDFNLALERRLRKRGVPIAHLVSPSIWAWRAGRIKAIARSVDRMLYLFPFEAAAYANSTVANQYVGHPLADEMPLEVSQKAARESLGLKTQGRVVALMPGSRLGELRAHGQLFMAVVRKLCVIDSSLSFILPAANASCAQFLAALLDEAGDLPVQLCDGLSATALAACDAALITSGTATLEAALVKRPMVVVYRTSALSWAVLSRLVHTPHVALPNLLHGDTLVPEFLQEKATAQALATALWQQLEDTANRSRLDKAFAEIHHTLRRGCADNVSAALLELGSCSNL
ncbi:MAG: lipid-A-disaccharide synthase [Halioglobus sp.]